MRQRKGKEAQDSATKPITTGEGKTVKEKETEKKKGKGNNIRHTEKQSDAKSKNRGIKKTETNVNEIEGQSRSGRKKQVSLLNSLTLMDWIILMFGAAFFLSSVALFRDQSLPDRLLSSSSSSSSVSSKNSGLGLKNAADRDGASPMQDKKDEKIYSDPIEHGTMLTKEQLSTFNGMDNPGKKTYLAILGEIYDVSSGEFYKPNGGYDFFVATDASKGFSTGEPGENLEVLDENMTKSMIAGKTHVVGRDSSVLSSVLFIFLGVVSWVMFYRDHEQYPYVGKVIGRCV